MRRPPILSVLLLAGCAGAPPAGPSPVARPDVAEILPLPAGTRLHAELAAGVEDTPQARAALVWWREALRQSVRFDVDEDNATGAPRRVLLALEPVSRRLSAFCTLPEGEARAIHGGTYDDGKLATGIDRLALAVRLALGERDASALPVALVTSPEPRALLDVVDAQALLRDGGVQAATRAFLAARARDGGSPFVLEGLAAAYVLGGRAADAERLCREALGYTARLSPMTQHRLASTLLLARAALQPDRAPEYDADLATLGAVYRRERPHDPQGPLTAALAANFQGDHATARDLLLALRQRLAGNAFVCYHLGWACLATGDPVRAVEAFDDAAARLPENWTTIPQAIALHAAGRDPDLERLLQLRLEETDARQFEQRHELRRMAAALSLLRGDLATARTRITADLTDLLAHPTLLDVRSGELGDEGEVLVRIGGADALPGLLAALQAQNPGTAIADVAAFLSGMAEIARTKERMPELEGRIARGGDSVFALRLQAFAHELRGEIADMHAALARSARLSDAPLTKAMLVRSLHAMGRTDEAAVLRDALRRDLQAIALRRRPTSPLLGPELAFAYLVE